jgi:hypothetical protein
MLLNFGRTGENMINLTAVFIDEDMEYSDVSKAQPASDIKMQ